MSGVLQIFPLVALVLLPAARQAWADPLEHEWCRLAAPRFEIVTDLGERRTRRIAQRMASFREAVEPFLFPDNPVEELPLRVVIFRDRADFRSAMDTDDFSGFTLPSLRETRIFVGPGPASGAIEQTALHEYTHYLLRSRVDQSVPIWYEEGLASFLSTARPVGEVLRVGDAPVGDMWRAITTGPLSLSDVTEVRDVFELDARALDDLYLTSWALLHTLILGKGADGAARAPSPRLDVPIGRLNARVRKHLRRERLPTLKLPLPAEPRGPLEYECLSPAQRDRELALAMLERQPERALGLLQGLREQDAHSVEILLGLSEALERLDDFAAALEHAETALNMGGPSAGPAIRVASLLANRCMFRRSEACDADWARATGLFRDGLRLDPDRFDAVLGLGLSYLHSGRPGEALNYLRIAYAKAPWAPQINYYLGECYRLLGDTRAPRYLVNARNWSGDEIWRKLAIASLGVLETEAAH